MMLSFFYELYTKKIGVGNPIFWGIRYKSLLRVVVRSVVQILMPIYYRLNKRRLNPDGNLIEGRNKRIIVSMTSFPARINSVWQVIESLMHQSLQPDMIILYLSKEQFPNLFFSLPSNLIKLQERGLKIVFVEDDIRSHKKYYYVFQEYPNDLIITVDDDIFYHPQTIESLYNKYIETKGGVIANQTAIIKYINEELLPYSSWSIDKKISSEAILPRLQIGVGGVLYEPTTLYKDVLNIELALELCPLADDIWLNVMTRLNKLQVYATSLSLIYLPVYIKKNTTLCSINNGQNMNDKQIKQVRDYYCEHLKIDVYSNKKYV